MRKRPLLLAAAVAVAGLAALGTVVAQQPYQPPAGSNYNQPKVAPSSGTLPATTVRPYGDWTPTPPAVGYTPTQPSGGTRPAGGGYLPPPNNAKGQPIAFPPPGGTPTNRPKFTKPGVAGDVKPAGAFDIPPPNMDFSGIGAKAPTPATPPATGNPLPPPSISVESSDNKFPPTLPLPTQPPATTQPPPNFVPVPPPPTGGFTPPPPAFPSTPVAPPAPPAPTGSPKPFPVPPAAPTVGSGALPSKVTQSVTVEAMCPDAVVFGSELRYELIVRNAGNVAVQNVRVEDVIPAGSRYIGSDPPGEMSGDRLVWALGAMDSQAEKRIVVRVRPNEEGELRSRAAVSYTAAVEVKTKVTRPRIAVSVVAPEVSRVGEEAVFRIKVANSGTGPAQQMVLQALLSDGLYHPQGVKLETKLANLAAGDTKTVDLPLGAAKAGLQVCQFTVSAEGSQDSTAKAQVNVVEPLLKIAQSGPEKCIVRGEPTYEVTLSNPGTAATDPITLHAVLPDGFDFVQASDAGAFSTTHRAVTWKLAGLPAGGTKQVALKLRAAAAGDVVLRTVAVAAPDQGIVPAGGGAVRPTGRVLEAKGETTIKAEGVAAVRFEVKDLDDPVEVGKEAVYEIRVTNQGTGACTNVQLLAAISDGTTFSSANGPTAVKAQGQTLVFDPIQTLPVKGEMVYTVRVRGNAAGDQRFRVQLTCDQVRTPVVKEESTSFYKQ